MKKRLFSFIFVLCTLCLLTLSACAAEGTGAPSDEPETLNSAPSAPRSAFTDIPVDVWYADAVEYCSGHGLISGTTDATFSPNAAMTRSMLAAVLYRMVGSPTVTTAPRFSDTAGGAWYSDAVVWAADTGIISGYGDGAFGVDTPVTREQIAVILWRYAGSPIAGAAEAFEDAASISDWALPAVNWARDSGIMTGKADNRFEPKADVTRAEAAAVLHHYLDGGREAAPALSGGDMVISVAGRNFSVTLEDNAASRALMEKLPLAVTMGELNGNEKYYYMPAALPASPEKPGTIQAGDLMLYGSDCLVLFYESFLSSYSYTRLGRIEDPVGLAEAVGVGDVEVTFQMQKTGSMARPAGDSPAFDFETRRVMLNSGYEMPIYGLGTYSLHDEVCVASVSAALERGVRLIDTAHAYGNEESVGEAIRGSGVPREDIFVITKLYPDQFANAEAAIAEALEKLDIGYIDLMLLHHPGTGDVAAYQAMEEAVGEGKIRSLGLSNWYVEELEEFLSKVTITPALVQNEIHPYYQENDVIPYIQSLGIVVQGWYPLGGRGHTAELLGNTVISEIAQTHGKSPAQVILRWNLQKGVVVIPGSSNPDHIQENTQLFDFELSDEEMARINALDRNEKHDWY